MLFLLGPGYPPSELERRRRLAHELQELGIKAIVMEDLPQWRSRTLSGKFLDIINDFEPDLFIAIFTRAGRAVGITFELGFLTGLLGLGELLRRLRYCVEMKLDEARVMTAYVREQLPLARTVRFTDDAGLLRAVLNFVDNYVLDQGWV